MNTDNANNTSMVRMTAVFPDTMAEELRRRAFADDRSTASVIRIAVREYLERRRKEDERRTGGRSGRGRTVCV